MKRKKTPSVSSGIDKMATSFFVCAFICILSIISFKDSFSGTKIQGDVSFQTGTAVPNGIIIIYRLHDIYQFPIFVKADDIDEEGRYKISPGNITDTLYAIVIPDHSGSGYVPTFFPNDIDWTTAGDIIFPGTFPTGTEETDIIVINLQNPGRPTNPATLEGRVDLLVSKESGPIRSFAYAMQGEDVVGYGEIGVDGKYKIDMLAEGTYDVMVSMIGYPTLKSTVHLQAGGSSKVDFNILTGRSTVSEGSVKLNQNYPNPFNPSTEIRFTVPETSLVKLQIFDAAGRQVALLVNGSVEKGAHAVNFNASTLTSGIYFYKLTSGNFTETRKMLLVK